MPPRGSGDKSPNASKLSEWNIHRHHRNRTHERHKSLGEGQGKGQGKQASETS